MIIFPVGDLPVLHFHFLVIDAISHEKPTPVPLKRLFACEITSAATVDSIADISHRRIDIACLRCLSESLDNLRRFEWIAGGCRLHCRCRRGSGETTRARCKDLSQTDEQHKNDE